MIVRAVDIISWLQRRRFSNERGLGQYLQAYPAPAIGEMVHSVPQLLDNAFEASGADIGFSNRGRTGFGVVD